MGARVTLLLFLFTAIRLSSFYCIKSDTMKTRICFSRLDLLPHVVYRLCSITTQCSKPATVAFQVSLLARKDGARMESDDTKSQLPACPLSTVWFHSIGHDECSGQVYDSSYREN